MFWGGLKNVTVSEPPVWTIRHCSKLKPPKRGKKEKGVPMEVKTGKKIPHTHSYYHISPPLQKEANPVQQLKAKSPVNFHHAVAQKDKKAKSKPTKEITHHHQRSPTELVAHYEIIFWAV
jgi:SET domain-containing protein